MNRWWFEKKNEFNCQHVFDTDMVDMDLVDTDMVDMDIADMDMVDMVDMGLGTFSKKNGKMWEFWKNRGGGAYPNPTSIFHFF